MDEKKRVKIVMAKTFSKLISVPFAILFYLAVATEGSYYKELPSKLKLGPQQLTYLHFYLHEFLRTSNGTEVTVAFNSTQVTASGIPFGLTAVYDYLMTEGNSTDTKEVGKAQGILAVSSQTEDSVVMAFNFLFTRGKFNGSTIAVLGRNNLDLVKREMPVLGGTGAFRFSNGYILTTTINSSTTYNIFEYDLYVYHYDL